MSPSVPEQCEVPECERNLEAKGLCRSHRRALEEHGDIWVQAVVDEREHRLDLEQADQLDWTYLSDDQSKAIERGVWDAALDAGLNFHDRQNVHQEMLVWAAGHKKDVQAVRSKSQLRLQMKRQAIKLHRTQWRDERQLDSLDAMFEDEPEVA